MPAARRRVLAWAPVLAWAALIFAFSAQSNLRFVEDPGLDFVVRKAGHMAVFGILALLAWRAIATTTRLRPAWVWAAVMAIFYAATDELHQGVVTGRHPAFSDVAIDTTGVLLSVAVVLVLLRGRQRPMRLGDSRQGCDPTNRG